MRSASRRRACYKRPTLTRPLISWTPWRKISLKVSQKGWTETHRSRVNQILKFKFLEYLIATRLLTKKIKNLKINWETIKHSRIFFFKLIWWILTFPVCRIMEFAVWARQWAGDPQESTVVRLRLLPRARHSHVRILLCWQRREESRPSIHVVRA